MDKTNKDQIEKQITAEEANRVLEVGRLLFSVLTPEEVEELQKLLSFAVWHQSQSERLPRDDLRCRSREVFTPRLVPG